MTIKLNCPVCGYTEIEGNTCPNCDTDLSLMRMLQELPQAKTPRKAKVAAWQLAAAGVILLIGMGLGALGSFLFPQILTATVTSPSPVVISSPSPTLTPIPPVVPVKPPEPTIYTVKSGDSLSKIAKRFYGDDTLWTFLVKANPKLKSREDFLEVGESLIVANYKGASCGSF